MSRKLDYETWQRAKLLVSRDFKPHYCIYIGFPHVFYWDTSARKVRIAITTEFCYRRYEELITYLFGPPNFKMK